MTERLNQILNHHLYKEYVWKTKEAETDRLFCKHDIKHFLDVARLAMILNQKEGLQLPEELLYAAALLHDIGRFQQYQDGTPHEQVSYELAPEILKDCGFQKQEQERILSAILHHREKENSTAPTMDGLLYRADKMSRTCYACDALQQCKWSDEKKNLHLLY